MATAGDSTIDAARRRRIVVVLGVVIAAHAGLLVWALATRDRTLERPVEVRTIVARLLRDEPPAVVPAVVAAVAPVVPAVSAAPAVMPTPQTLPPPVRSKPQSQPRSRPPRSAAVPVPVPVPVPAVAPSRDTLPVPVPEPAAAPSAAAPPPAAPAPLPSTSAAAHAPSATGTPKTVSHVDCDIPKPDYPDMSKRRNESGTAIVRFVVGLGGQIETAQLQKSSGYARLDEAALAAIHNGVCQPYRENGEAVRAAYSQSFVFGLTE